MGPRKQESGSGLPFGPKFVMDHRGIEIHGVLIVQALAAYFAQTAVDSERMSVRSVRTIKVRP